MGEIKKDRKKKVSPTRENGKKEVGILQQHMRGDGNMREMLVSGKDQGEAAKWKGEEKGPPDCKEPIPKKKKIMGEAVDRTRL